MNAKLRSDIESLLSKHPELRNRKLHFSESEFELFDGNISDKSFKPPVANFPCESIDKLPMTIVGNSQKVEIRLSPVHGYGIFAKESIETGELIEEGKLLKLKNRAKYNHDKVLRDYTWGQNDCNCFECKKHGVNQYIALGFGSLYNHADDPNTIQYIDFRKQIFTIKAGLHILKDQEIFIHYGKKYWQIRNIWRSIYENETWQAYLIERSNKHLKKASKD